LQAAPQAAAPDHPSPSPAEPSQVGPSRVRPAPRHKPAPTRPPAHVAAPGLLHVQPAITRHSNSSPKPPPKSTVTHPNRAHGKGAHGKHSRPNLDAAKARMRQASVIIANLSRDTGDISKIIALPRSPNEQ